MRKHAYLIVAHNEENILKKLVSLLDYKENDIYIHLDVKANWIDKRDLLNFVQEASIEFVPSCNIAWGGESQIKCELSLLECATKSYHDYYHLISGVDLPIKSHEQIMIFFEKNYGKEFIEFDNRYEDERTEYRVRYYHLLQDMIGKPKDSMGKLLYVLERIIVKLQKIIGVNRIRKLDKRFYKGTNWFSITHQLALYVLNDSENIMKDYKYTYCADEVFLHTIVKNSMFNSNIINDCLRYIDWDRGQPYTFALEDYELLMNSDKLWARKFSEKKDLDIVNKIYNTLKK